MIIKFNENAKLKIGDKVTWTTSEFPYDNYYGCFVSPDELTHYADIDAEYIGEDYSEYNPRTCRNGGGYGYEYYTITKIYKIGEI